MARGAYTILLTKGLAVAAISADSLVSHLKYSLCYRPTGHNSVSPKRHVLSCYYGRGDFCGSDDGGRTGKASKCIGENTAVL